MPENMPRKQEGSTRPQNQERKGGPGLMSRILNVTPNDDYTLLIKFEQGNEILFNMKPMLKSLPYRILNDLTRFRNITLEEKAICWPDPAAPDESIVPLRLTVDNILFTIRG
jgi:hypothetical protein